AHRDDPPARRGTGRAGAPRRSARAERLGRLTGGRVLAPDRTGVPLVKPLVSLSRAMFLGFFRDRMTLFWAVLFPLMFLVLFGGIFSDQTAAKIEIAQVGPVAAIDRMPAPAREAFDESVDVDQVADLDAAVERVAEGEIAAAVVEHDGRVVVHFSKADQVAAGRVYAIFQGLVDSANLALSGVEPQFVLDAQPVEDESLKTIQYVTPSLPGWAIAKSPTFGAATNLVTWRRTGLLPRLRSEGRRV